MKNLDLLTESYDYKLPEHLIALRPVADRSSCKLLVYKQTTDEIIHTEFSQIGDYLNPNQLLVLNESKVFPCRLLGMKPTGGRAELFILSLIPTDDGYPVFIGSNGKKKLGDEFHFETLIAKISAIGEEGEFFVEFNMTDLELFDFLEIKAKIPIPPYIRNGVADEQDKKDYQTVYAKHVGSVAAPTAGLHFTDDLFESLNKQGIDKAFVTLHVGAGTFKPVSTEQILDHKMHSEKFTIAEKDLNKINSGKELIAVGTTSLRVLESCYENQRINFGENQFESTDIFLYPGKEVKSIKGLITNFHLPKSTLLMLVSALLGREKTLALYEEAIEKGYRFFSYGDAMLILRD